MDMDYSVIHWKSRNNVVLQIYFSNKEVGKLKVSVGHYQKNGRVVGCVKVKAEKLLSIAVRVIRIILQSGFKSLSKGEMDKPGKPGYYMHNFSASAQKKRCLLDTFFHLFLKYNVHQLP